MRKSIMVTSAPTPAGPYSHAVIANGFVYVSGQGPKNPQTGTIPETFVDQVQQTLNNLKTILEGAGVSLNDVVKINAYLTDLANFQAYNDVYKGFFPESPPARTTVGAQLKGILVEIDCIAVLPTNVEK